MTRVNARDKLASVYESKILLEGRRLVLYDEFSIGRCFKTICMGVPPNSRIISATFEFVATGIPMPVAFVLT